jgi:hypothetical protein
MTAHTHVAVGYNVLIAVDAKHKLIVEQQVTEPSCGYGAPGPDRRTGKEVLGAERIAVVADRDYFKIKDIEACEKAGIHPYVPRPQRDPSVRAGRFRKDEFSYDPTSDSFPCPAGQRLHPYSSSLMRGLKKINTTTTRPAETARSAHNARAINSAACRVSRTRPYWIECRPA